MLSRILGIEAEATHVKVNQVCWRITVIRLIILLVIVGGLGAGGYFLWKNDGDPNKALKDAQKNLNEVVNEASGYPDAKTPKELSDLFCKAIKNRDYSSAARYCNGGYAEILSKAAVSAKKLGVALDDVADQLREKGVNTDEMRAILFYYDPFWKDVTGVITNESANSALVTITPNLPRLTGQPLSAYTEWKIDKSFMGALLGGPFELPIRIRAVKDGEIWKLELPTPPNVQVMVTKLNDKSRLYVRKLEMLQSQIRTDPDTKENIRKRMKELLEDAAKE
jgi:hypothetical protein